MTNQSLLPVTQKDREAYLSLNMLPPEDADAVRAGKWDGVTGMQVLARHRLDHTAPADVALRWEGDKLWLGEHYAGQVIELDDLRWGAEVRLGWKTTFHDTRKDATAWVEQSVRDWLARAGLVRQGGGPVAWPNGCDKTAPAALRYLARHDRPIGGEQYYNAAHLWQIADELEKFASKPLYAHPPASPTAEVVEALRAAREAIHHRGGPLCASRYYSASQCDCGAADAIADIDAALAKVQKP